MGHKNFIASYICRVPIHEELCVIHSEIVKIMYRLKNKNVHSYTFFLSKYIENYHFSFTLLQVCPALLCLGIQMIFLSFFISFLESISFSESIFLCC